MYCKYCNNQIDENSSYCKFCGKQILNLKKDGNGKAIASMVLGIVAASWAFLTLLAFKNLYTINNTVSSFYELIAYYIGFNLFSLPTGIIGLSLGISSKNKCSKRTSGIILSAISLFIALISLIVIIACYIN